MIESRCGILCSSCELKMSTGCTGCLSAESPFWGQCPVKLCCESKSHENCGYCSDFACALLNSFSYDKEHGDNGLRIEQCRKWKEGIRHE